MGEIKNVEIFENRKIENIYHHRGDEYDYEMKDIRIYFTDPYDILSEIDSNDEIDGDYTNDESSIDDLYASYDSF